ncbi:MAG: hypothetical protein JWM95_5635 [Gemmatimonadetes bacterium]|nr:hypothetical protein [Gemmatimonadota bacterium]
MTVCGAMLWIAGCAQSSATSSQSPLADMSMSPPSPDPRIGLKAGLMNTAGQAAWNMHLESNSAPSEKFVGVTSSDLAFIGHYAIQGNYNGYQVWDISNPAAPTLTTSYFCPASQSDVSVYKNLLFVSAEAPTARLDCGAGGVADTVSKERIRGVRIFDATDIAHPKYLANVQTCRGSHTHTVVHDPNDAENVYIYISGTSAIRSPSELPGCIASPEDPNTALFRIEVIKIPLAHPERAAIVSSPRIFADDNGKPLVGVASHAPPASDTGAAGRAGRAGGAAGGRAGAPGAPARPNLPRGTLTQCHDITVYPAIGLAGGACAGMGLLLDIKDVAHPRRIAQYSDSNFSFWHSATFSNDGSKVLFSDEWGGGSAAYCRATDPKEWGADAIFTIENGKLNFKSYYKMPAAQTPFENCVAHNGSLIPIPGRDIMVQSWYQGGISVFEWTDPSHPREIAFFDRGPNDSTRLAGGGFWSSYWYNGVIVGSDEKRGLDVFTLRPSAFISQNELDAAKSVVMTFLNVQDQPRLVWPATFALSRAYLDQLARDGGQTPERISAARAALVSAEKLSGQARKDALDALAKQLHGEAQTAKDAPKAHKLAFSVGDLAKL